MIRLISLLAILVSVAFAAPNNYKSGISLAFSGVEGTSYASEDLYYNTPVGTDQTIYIRDDTLITMSHNARNVASTTSGNKVVIGSGGGGVIRYGIDKMWAEIFWSFYNPAVRKYTAYSAPFALNTQTYEVGVPVVGTTGGNGFLETDRNNFYWRGLLEDLGNGSGGVSAQKEEWHVFKYADDDQTISTGPDDSWASDGKWTMMVVNPKTPALSMAQGDSTGQWYTTPAYIYFKPVIHAQTTYFQGNINLTLRNIYGANISYKLNGGSTVNVGAASVTLTQAAFSSGSNTLEYWYTATPTVTRTRTIVKNPGFPSAGETHGNLLWENTAGYNKVLDRITRAPYLAKYNTYSTASGSGQTNWDSVSGQGFRLGAGSNNVAAWQAGQAGQNALQAKILGNNAVRSGGVKTYAEYAKEMLIEGAWTTPQLGYELFITGYPQATQELDYRGYWEVVGITDPAFAYDLLISFYRSDQHVNGITPIQDYFIRDTFAEYVWYCTFNMGSWQSATGMWYTSRNVGAAMVTAAMQSYSTPYYGTSGMDGNTTVYARTPWRTNNYTWKTLFYDQNNPLGTYPDAPVYAFGLENGAYNYALIATTLNVYGNPATLGDWNDKSSYTSIYQCGLVWGLYRNLSAIYAPAVTHVPLDAFYNRITAGAVMCWKPEQSGDPVPTAARRSSILVLNDRWDQPAINAQSWAKSLPSNNSESPLEGVTNTNYLGFIFYDDRWFGVDPLPAPTGLDVTSTTATTITMTWNDTTPANTATFVVQRSAAGAGVYVDVGTTGVGVLTYTDTALASNTTYDYRVYDVYLNAPSDYSNVDSGTTLPPSGTPIGGANPSQVASVP